MRIQKEFIKISTGTVKITAINPAPKYHLNYNFNVGLAQSYGVDEAIVLNNFIYWIEQNKANNINFYDGFYWTYNSVKAFQEIYPFWSSGQITRVLKSLESKGIIKSGNYNKIPYDQTKWYTIIDFSIYRNQQMEMQEPTNQNAEIDKPIPTHNPSLNPTIKDSLSGKPDGAPDFIKQVIDYLNQKTGKSFKSSSAKTRTLIKARVMELATLDDFKQVIDNKVGQWLNDPKMSKFLRPETLFGTKFESYLNEKPSVDNKYEINSDGMKIYKYDPNERF